MIVIAAERDLTLPEPLSFERSGLRDIREILSQVLAQYDLEANRETPDATDGLAVS